MSEQLPQNASPQLQAEANVPLSHTPIPMDRELAEMLREGFDRHQAAQMAPLMHDIKLATSHRSSVRYAPMTTHTGRAYVPVFEGETDSQAVERERVKRFNESRNGLSTFKQQTAQQVGGVATTLGSALYNEAFGEDYYTPYTGAEVMQTGLGQGARRLNDWLTGERTADVLAGDTGMDPDLMAVTHALANAPGSAWDNFVREPLRMLLARPLGFAGGLLAAPGFALAGKDPATARDWALNQGRQGMVENLSTLQAGLQFPGQLGRSLAGSGEVGSMFQQDPFGTIEMAGLAAGGALGAAKVMEGIGRRPYTYDSWAQQNFGNLGLARPVTLSRVEGSLRAAGASFTPQGINIPSKATPESVDAVKSAINALRAETGSSTKIKLIRGQQPAQIGGFNLPLNVNIYEDVTPQGSRGALLGGRGNVVELTDRRMAGPFGPTQPGVSSAHVTPDISDAPGVPAEILQGVRAAANEAHNIRLSQTSALEGDRIAKGIDAALAARMDPTTGAALEPDMAAMVQTTLLRGVSDLAGRDHKRIGALVGFDYQPLIFGGQPLAPAQVGPVVHTVRWAAGVLDAADRAGIKADQIISTLPPPPAADPIFAIARIKGLADVIAQQESGATVGPPPELAGAIDPALLNQRPISLEPLGRAPEFPTTSEVWNAPSRYMPTAEDFSVDAARAAQRQQFVTMTLSSWQPFLAGRLFARNGDALYGHEPRVIPIHVDSEGRLIAQAQDPTNFFETVDVDVTTGTLSLGLPADAKWQFVPDKSAPVAFKLDNRTEGLIIDPNETVSRDWLQDRWKERVETPVGRPLEDPLLYLSTVTQNPPQSLAHAYSVLDDVRAMERAHATKAPTHARVREDLGEGAADYEVAYVHGTRLREYAAIAAAIEGARRVALQRIAAEVPPTSWGLPHPVSERRLGQASEFARYLEDQPERGLETPPIGVGLSGSQIARRAGDAADSFAPIAPPSPGFTRLYRAEGVGEATYPEWIKQGMQESGQAAAMGRWFTNDLDVAKIYLRDFVGPKGRLVYVDIPNTEAEQAHLLRLPADHSARKFSRRPEEEFFLSSESAGKKQALPQLDPRHDAAIRRGIDDATIEAMGGRIREGTLSEGLHPTIRALVEESSLDPMLATNKDAVQELLSIRERDTGAPRWTPENLANWLAVWSFERRRPMPDGWTEWFGDQLPPMYEAPKSFPEAMTRFPAQALDPDLSAKREAAYQHFKAGLSFHGKADLFEALPDDDKYRYTLGRIEEGYIAPGRRHLDNLNPTKRKSYWGSWKPTPSQLHDLKVAYAERVARERVANGALDSAKARAHGGYGKRIPLEDLLQIHPEALRLIHEKDPLAFDRLAKDMEPTLLDPKSLTAEEKALLERGADAQIHMDKLRDNFRVLLDEHVGRMPEPIKHDPLSGIARTFLGLQAKLKGVRAFLRALETPYYKIGPARQAPHPADIMAMIRSGQWDRGIYQMGSRAALSEIQEQLRFHQDFHVLQIAANNSEPLHKAIFKALEFNLPIDELVRPEYDFKVRVRGVKQTIKLSEWVPKLREHYDRVISLVENSKIEEWNELRGACYMRGIFLKESLLNDELTDHDRKATEEMLAETARLYEEASTNINGIRDGSMRLKGGYITHIYNLTKRDVLQALENPHSNEARFISPKVRQDFIEHRDKEGLPIATWLDTVHLYNKQMFRIAYLEPALRRIRHKLEDFRKEASTPGIDPQRKLDLTEQADYTIAWMGRLKEQPTNEEVLLNRAFYHSFEQRNLVDNIVEGLSAGASKLTGGRLRKVDLDAIYERGKEEGLVSPRGMTRGIATSNDATYLTLLDPITIGILNLTEGAYAMAPFSQKPTDLFRAPLWLARGAAEMVGQGLLEGMSALGHAALPKQIPLWYSEPTRMGVTSFVHDMQPDSALERVGALTVRGPINMGPLKRAGRIALRIWSSPTPLSDFVTRATLHNAFYYWMRREMPGLTPQRWAEAAAMFTNNLVGSYSTRDSNPIRSTPTWRAILMLRKFASNKATRVSEAMASVLPSNAQQPQEFRDVLPDEPPPRPPDFPFPELDPDAWRAFKAFQDPPAPQGTGVPYGPAARRHLALKLTLGSGVTAASLLYLGGLLLNDADDGNQGTFDRLWPFNFTRLAEMAPLHWVDEAMTYTGLKLRGLAYTLNGRQEEKMRKAEEELLTRDIPALSIYFRRKAAREREEARKLQGAVNMELWMRGLDPDKLHLPTLPGEKRGDEIVQHGLLEKPIDALIGAGRATREKIKGATQEAP